MTESGMPETIVEIKKWLQKFISKNARVIDKNDQIRRFNSGETKWKPRKTGLCNWLKISTDSKRHLMVWTIDANDHMKGQARVLADHVEEIIKKELNQIVPIEFKDAPKYIVTCTGKSISICHGELVTEPVEDECPF
jgi:hypothetical protein